MSGRDLGPLFPGFRQADRDGLLSARDLFAAPAAFQLAFLELLEDLSDLFLRLFAVPSHFFLPQDSRLQALSPLSASVVPTPFGGDGGVQGAKSGVFSRVAGRNPVTADYPGRPADETGGLRH